MAILDDVKKALRITTGDFDTEVQGLIDACKEDLKQAGIYAVDDTDVLIKRAIIVYSKANFGFDNPEADRLQDTYKMLKNHLSMSSDYSYYKVTINASEQCKVTFDGETKETDDSGEVVFYSREQNHVSYKIADGEIQYIDITADTTISG